MIPLVKNASPLETAEEYFWSSGAGPCENLFRLAENLGIIFGGGPLSLVAMGLEAAGIDLGDVGKVLDENLGLTKISDVMSLDPSKLGEVAAGALDQAGAEGQAQTGHPQSTGGFGSPLGAHASIRFDLKTAAEEATQTRKNPFSNTQTPHAVNDDDSDILSGLLNGGAENDPGLESKRDPLYGLEGTQTHKDFNMSNKVKVRWLRDLGEPKPSELLQEQRLRKRHEQLMDRAHDPNIAEDTFVDPSGAPGAAVPPAAHNIVNQKSPYNAPRQHGRADPRLVQNYSPKVAPSVNPEEVQMEKARRNHELKKMKADEKLWKAKESAHRRGWGFGGWGSKVGKAGLGLGLGGLIAYLFKQVADPKSKISAALRAAGVVGAETIQQHFNPHQQQPHKTAPSASSSTNPKRRLEAVVDNILGA